ncbi:peptide deformylase [Acetobacterium bakii]|uniref:Peptide deformylase n=1 Tax=Acetobacterium bakii TaxID=52689 RepID=A0A0L6TYW3_9FIRM|nr:peptide deformylase [Acetobacterium bakii]KNZ40760.1 peptide deformylase [Acetobacterium bakii]
MAVRNIRNYKDITNILRKKSRTVNEIDEKIIRMFEDMTETMYLNKGIGLAAPQVGILKRLVVIDIGTGLLKLVNPVIVQTIGEKVEEEGCLSIPGIFGDVIRPQKVCIRAQNERGKLIELEGIDFLARVFCHEIDHLDGTLFIDKMVSKVTN